MSEATTKTPRAKRTKGKAGAAALVALETLKAPGLGKLRADARAKLEEAHAAMENAAADFFTATHDLWAATAALDALLEHPGHPGQESEELVQRWTEIIRAAAAGELGNLIEIGQSIGAKNVPGIPEIEQLMVGARELHKRLAPEQGAAS